MPHGLRTIEVALEREMKQAYLDYAMSVIIGRALPDVRDGLKPVHRRILYAMYEMGLLHNKPYKKSARVVGEVLGKYHPHGDASVYDALVRMAQDFVMNYPLVDGHGNFGSIDGDPPAAMRYTEVRLSKIAEEMLKDIDKETVDFVPNFDGTLKEPVVLPAAFPNLLVNGSSGIAVGMATNIPPHNLNEIVDALVFLIDNRNREIKDEELLAIVKGPDFPTGGIVLGVDGIRKAYLTGKGKIIIRGRVNIEEGGRTTKIVITEVPYQVNKARMIERIAGLVREGVIDGIKDIRDESDREGLRVVIELRRDADANVVLNQLYKHTELETSFNFLSLALVDNQPRILTLRQMLEEFLRHRFTVIRRKAAHELRLAKERAHIVDGLLVALANIDEVIELIKKSKDRKEAMQALISSFQLSEKQSNAILTMQLQKLTSIEVQKLKEEKKELERRIENLEKIMRDDDEVYRILREEFLELKKSYGMPRKTSIEERYEEIDLEDLVQEEEVMVVCTRDGFIKRVPARLYRSQRRGGTGIISQKSGEKDYTKHLVVCSTHDTLLIFTTKGIVRALKAYEVPEASRQSRGKHLSQLVRLDGEERVAAILPLKKENSCKYLLMYTKRGVVKKSELYLFENVRRSGVIAIKLRKDDGLVGAMLTSGRNTILLATKKGMAILFKEEDVRPMGRNAAGVTGIKLENDDEVVSGDVADNCEYTLTVTSRGFVKKTRLDEYRVIGRGGKGVINVKLREKNGEVVTTLCVNDNDELVAITASGMAIRVSVKSIPEQGRNAMGVRLIKLKEGDRVVDAAKIINI